MAVCLVEKRKEERPPKIYNDINVINKHELTIGIARCRGQNLKLRQ